MGYAFCVDILASLNRMGSDLKFAAGKPRLTNDGLQGADFDFRMIWNRDGHRGFAYPPLHDDMAAAPANFFEPVVREDRADPFSRENAEPTQPVSLTA